MFYILRPFSSASPAQLLRNIGIIAHIDAGKTTLTERFLFHAGVTRRVGSVDRGDTVLDYLPQERSRGITIKAACITIPWRQRYKISIIDTPGHVDFGLEVERAVRVMDGAVALVDGSAGVQAQTLTVWQQAERFGVKRLVFVNKLDKPGADFIATLRDMERKFKIPTLCLLHPRYSNDGELVGVHDVLNSQIISFSGDHGEHVNIQNANDHKKKMELLERIAELDEAFLDEYLENQEQSLENTKEAIRRIVRQGKAIPVLAGSAFRNVSVQLVLDAVVEYLPEPSIDKHRDALALVFKVVSDEQRGLLVFVRVYSGVITSKTILHNLSKGNKRERVVKVMQAHGKDLHEIEAAHAGQIVVLIGPKMTATGDTLCASTEQEALPGVSIPQPVFQMACTLYSQSEEERVETVLKTMSLEDPSLRVEKDSNTGQLIVSGMGELHLEIAGQRLREDYKCSNVHLGPVRIAYKECITEKIKGEFVEAIYAIPLN